MSQMNPKKLSYNPITSFKAFCACEIYRKILLQIEKSIKNDVYLTLQNDPVKRAAKILIRKVKI